jgi:hypothetical protein
MRWYPNRFYKEITTTFLPLGRFLANEVNTKAGHLHEFWGGGFELTSFVDGAFKKLDDILYVIVEVIIGENRRSASFHATRLIKLKYVREHLLIRSLEVRPIERRVYKIIRDQVSYVAPLVRTSQKPESVGISLDENCWVCFASAFVGPGGQHDSLVMLIPDYERIGAINDATNLPERPCKITAIDGDTIRTDLSSELEQMFAHAIFDNASKGQPRATGWIWPSEPI